MTYIVTVRDKERETTDKGTKITNATRAIVAFSYKNLLEILSLTDSERFELLEIKRAGSLENGKDVERELIEEAKPKDLNIDLKTDEKEEE